MSDSGASAAALSKPVLKLNQNQPTGLSDLRLAKNPEGKISDLALSRVVDNYRDLDVSRPSTDAEPDGYQSHYDQLCSANTLDDATSVVTDICSSLRSIRTNLPRVADEASRTGLVAKVDQFVTKVRTALQGLKDRSVISQKDLDAWNTRLDTLSKQSNMSLDNSVT